MNCDAGQPKTMQLSWTKAKVTYLCVYLWIWNFFILVAVSTPCYNLQTCYQCGVECQHNETTGISQTECIAYIDQTSIHVAEYHPSETRCVLGSCSGLVYKTPIDMFGFTANLDVRSFRYSCITDCPEFRLQQSSKEIEDTPTDSFASVSRSECIALCFDTEHCYMWDHKQSSSICYMHTDCGPTHSCSTNFFSLSYKTFWRTCLSSCGDPVVPQNGNVSFTDTITDSEATYSCNNGFIETTGSNTQTCLSNGSWSSPQPVCDASESITSAMPTVSTKTTSTSQSTSTNPATTSLSSNAQSSTPILSLSSVNTTVTSPTTESSSTPMSSTNPEMTSSTSPTTESSSPPMSSTNPEMTSSTSPTTESSSPPMSSTNPETTSSTSPTTESSSTSMSSTNPETTLSTSPTTESSSTQMSSTNTGGISSTVFATARSTTTKRAPEKIYIMPCICYENKTFTGKTDEEILNILIQDTKINVKNTGSAKNKVTSRDDSRPSSQAIGFVALGMIVLVLGSTIISDVFKIILKLRETFVTVTIPNEN